MRERTVVLYDPRGRGRSDEIKDPSLVGMDNEVRDIEALRRHLSLDRVSLVGWSYLGGVVALYAARYPERVDSVVQVGPMPLRKVPHWDAYLKSIQARRDPGHLPFAEQPAEFTRAVDTFLKGAWPDRAEASR
jgi:pimeloyl-ACP methyl ester carboxylesterase